MSLAYVTSRFPCGSGEEFLAPEVDALLAAGVDVAVVPLHSGSACLSGHWALWRTALLSPMTLVALASALVRHPRALLGSIRTIVRTSPRHAVLNLIVLPKACWLAAKVRRAQVEHIHAQWSTATATMAMVASRMTHVPWSFTVHRYDVLEDNLLAMKVRDAAFLRFPSESARADCRRIVGELPRSTFLSHMGVTVPAELAPPVVGVPVILCPAKLEPRKGQDVLITALASIDDEPWELWLAGEGESRSELERLTVDLGVGARVKFLGLLPHDELLRLYQSGQVALVVLATQHEGIPFSLIEAMAHGIPVISTPVGGIPELLRDDAGLMVPPGDPDALARQIRSLLQSPDERLRLTHAGRRRVIEEFELHQTVRVLVAAFAKAESAPLS